MRLLVEKKSHPQRRYYPLLHTVAHGFRIGVRHRIGFMKLLLQNEADLNGKDWPGQTVLESFTGVVSEPEDWIAIEVESPPKSRNSDKKQELAPVQLGSEMRLSLLLAQRREPTLRRSQDIMDLALDWCPPRLMGICDRVGLRHGPCSILSQRQFRQRE
jgi:hypothetical protein